jgi:hypothetical protein
MKSSAFPIPLSFPAAQARIILPSKLFGIAPHSDDPKKTVLEY